MVDALTGLSPETVVLIAVALGAVAQAWTGMGFSLVAAPALIAALGPADGVSTVLLLAMGASLIPLAKDWRYARPRAALGLLVPTIAFTPLVALALAHANTRWVALGAGVGVLVGVALLATGVRWAWLQRQRGAVAAGFSSAVLNVVGGVGGPPIGLYAANADWGPRPTRGTLSAFFLVQNAVTVLVVGIVLPSVGQVLALVVGSVLGTWLAPRLVSGVARHAVLAISAVGGVALILGST